MYVHVYMKFLKYQVIWNLPSVTMRSRWPRILPARDFPAL